MLVNKNHLHLNQQIIFVHRSFQGILETCRFGLYNLDHYQKLNRKPERLPDYSNFQKLSAWKVVYAFVVGRFLLFIIVGIGAEFLA